MRFRLDEQSVTAEMVLNEGIKVWYVPVVIEYFVPRCLVSKYFSLQGHSGLFGSTDRFLAPFGRGTFLLIGYFPVFFLQLPVLFRFRF